jgi:outer membrane protein
MNVFQPLPWGASFNIQQQAIYQERYWYVDGIYKDTEAETITEYNEYWRPYDRPWSASITASASLPLPGSKYFGPFATREVDLRQALLSLEQSDQSLKNQVNSVLGQVEAAFWDLVRTAHQLDATTVQRHNMGKIAEKTQRFFDLGKVEKYALMQINARLASIREQEATALNRYELASNRLNLLLGFDRSLLFLAEGYLPNLEQPLNISLEQALNEGAVNNPILTIQQINVDSSNLNLRQKQVQTRPDVSLATSVKAAESNSQFGYESAADAYSGVIDPDNITITTQVSYNLPLKNKLARANLGQAQTQHARQEIALRQARSQIQRDIRNAYANYQSADARIRIAAENLTLANTAFRKALAKQELRSVTEYEMITKNNDLLAARTLHIDAKFARKKAEAQLLTAMGRMTTRLEGLPPSTGPHTAAAPTFPVAVR